MLRVVIVGGGFAGLYAARELRKARDRVAVTLVDRRNHHLFQPLLYQVATGALSPGEIAQPLRSIFRRQSNVTVLLGEAVGIDPERREVCLSDGGVVPYDTLIVATGAHHAYFGHEAWAPFAPGLKTIDDAIEIRRRILIAFEAAERETDPQARREWMTFVIVGGGPTGVELAGALGEIANDTLRNDFRSIRPADAWIEVLEANDRILTTYPPDRSASAQQQLERLGVIVRTSCRVVHIEDGLVRYEGPSGSVEVRARTIIWAAGVQAASFGRAVADAVGASTDRSGGTSWTATSASPATRRSSSRATRRSSRGRRAARCPAWRRAGSRAASTPRASCWRGWTAGRLRRSATRTGATWRSSAACGASPTSAGSGPLGRQSGFLAWALWLGIHIVYLIGFANRVVVSVRWAWSFLTKGRSTRLITGSPLIPPIEHPGPEPPG